MPERLLAVVTGASSGIGEAFAKQLAGRGYDLLLTARREDRLRQLASDLSAAHRVSVEIFPADLTEDQARAALAERIRIASNFGLLVNNAGFGVVGLFHKASFVEQNRMHRLHVLTTLELSHAALTNLLARQDAGPRTGIINVSSVASFGQAPTSVSYNSTKAWMTSFTEGLAMEQRAERSGIRVQALCPGFTYSEFHDVLRMERTAVPKSFWMTADFVVAESLRGFDRGQIIVIPGWRYKLLSAFMRATPPPLMRCVAATAARRYRKPKAME